MGETTCGDWMLVAVSVESGLGFGWGRGVLN